MRKSVMTLFFVIGLSTLVFSQVPNPNPDPTPLDPRIQRANEITKRSSDLRMTEAFPVRSNKERKILNEEIRPIYRDSTKEERAAIAPTAAVSAENRAFLKGKKQGLSRLVADIGCFTKDDVVSAKKECIKHSMPGAGSAYSFRTGDYRIQRLADLNFRKDRFEALGMLSHGILVYLGDVPIESVTLESDGVKHLQKIKPAKNFAEAGAFADKLLKGFKNKDYVYASVMRAIPARTYVLRTIAYRGLAKKRVKGIVYNELNFDERRDIVVAFRVVAMNPGKDVTIAWKEMKNKKAPALAEK